MTISESLGSFRGEAKILRLRKVASGSNSIDHFNYKSGEVKENEKAQGYLEY